MNLLDEEIQENNSKKTAKRNLRNSLLALGLLIASGIAFLIGVDSFYPGHSDNLSQILIILFYGLMLFAAIVAILSLVYSFKATKKSKDNKNYIAIGINILVLLALLNEILQRL